MPEEWLYWVFNIESKGNPSATNPTSFATGLIGFMPYTAESLGTSIAALDSMTVKQQLKYVKLYLERVNPSKKFESYTDLYLAVFFPQAIGKSGDYVLGSQDKRGDKYVEKLTRQNKALDTNKDNKISKKEVTSFAESKC